MDLTSAFHADDRRLSSPDWLTLLGFVAVFAAGWLLVGAARNVPVMDDWLYAGSVEHFLATGRLAIAEYSAIYPVTQILWGALFARLFGFSFAALRGSTVFVAVLGCWALYLTSRELGYSRTTSLLVALALALDPAFFALSFSFMTDVPFVAASTIALFYYVSAARRDRADRAWMGSAFAVAAFLIRPLGVAIPVAALAAAPWRGPRRRLLAWIAPLALAVATMGLLWIVMSRAIGPLDMASTRVERLRWWRLVPARRYAAWNVEMLFEAMLPLAPLVLASRMSRRTLASIALVVAALAVALALTLQQIPSPLPDWQTWSLQEIATRTMMGCPLSPSAWSIRLAPWLRGLGLFVVAAFVVAIAGRLRLRRDSTCAPVENVVLAFGVLQWGLINLLWLYNDRYYLVLAPALAFLAIRLGRPRPAIGGAMLAVWALVGVTGTRDMLGFNDAAAQATRRLEASGVRPWQIDAGYALNGWRLYVHPENLPPGADRRYDVPFITGDLPTIYTIANCPMPGNEVVSVVPLPAATWQVTDRLYVLRRKR